MAAYPPDAGRIAKRRFDRRLEAHGAPASVEFNARFHPRWHQLRDGDPLADDWAGMLLDMIGVTQRHDDLVDDGVAGVAHERQARRLEPGGHGVGGAPLSLSMFLLFDGLEALARL